MYLMEIPYLEYFGLSEKPFGMSPDPEFYFESKEHKKAFDYLTFFVGQQEGFALIYGDVGSGKTTISRIFLNSLDTKKYNTALILNPVTDEAEFMREVLKEFGAACETKSRKDLYDTLRLFLLSEFQKGKENILVIDEAQLLSYEMLEFIRLLSNIETDKQKILHTIFFAQQEFLDKLKEGRLRHLAQRITVNFSIEPLSHSEVKSYINYRLFKAGSRGPLEFRDRAVRLIHIASRGYPRLINYLCDRCLIALYAQGAHVVDGHVVSRVIMEENIPLSSVKKGAGARKSPAASRIVALGAAFCGIVLLLLFYSPLHSRFFAPQEDRGQKAQPAVAVKEAGPAVPAIPEKADTPPTGVIPIPLRTVTVVADAANVRLDGALKAQKIGTIPKGTALTVFEEKVDAGNKVKWYRVGLPEGREGWVAAAVVKTRNNNR